MKTIIFASLVAVVAARRSLPTFPTETGPILSPYGPTKVGTYRKSLHPAQKEHLSRGPSPEFAVGRLIDIITHCCIVRSFFHLATTVNMNDDMIDMNF
jgi:hypothetical protein